ncbi:MAG: N-acetyltransferase family protein [Pseudomonadota bacterium]
MTGTTLATPVAATVDNAWKLRPARSSDLGSLADLLNEEILSGTASWTATPKTDEEMAHWIVQRTGAGFPVVVAQDAQRILGFASYGPFRRGEGYRQTVEHTVYVAPSARRRGVASALLERLISQAIEDGHHRMVAAISADQVASISLHEVFGFRRVGHLPEAGKKFGKWLDLVLMMRNLT